MDEEQKEIVKLVIENLKNDPSLYEETLETFPQLLHLNQMGFLTTNSQEGIREYGKIPKDVLKYTRTGNIILAEMKNEGCQEYTGVEEKVKKRYKEGWNESGLIESQRAYLSGFIPYQYSELFNYLVNLTDIVCIRLDHIHVPVTYSIGHTPSDTSDWPLTWYHGTYLNDRVPIMSRLLNGAKMENKSEILDDEEYYFGEKVRESDYPVRELFSYVEVFDPVHGRKVCSENGLYTVCTQVLEEIERLLSQ